MDLLQLLSQNGFEYIEGILTLTHYDKFSDFCYTLITEIDYLQYPQPVHKHRFYLIK